MANKVKGLIEFVGVAEDFPTSPTNFKQLSVQETLCIPEVKPDIEQIVTVAVDIVITKTKVIRTPGSAILPAISIEGQRLYGFKLVIEGYLCQTIEYVADEPTQSVHAAHFKVPFSSYIVLPPNFSPNAPLPTVTGYIEDIFVEQLDKRCIFKNVTILLVAQF